MLLLFDTVHGAQMLISVVKGIAVIDALFPIYFCIYFIKFIYLLVYSLNAILMVSCSNA